MSPLVFVVIGVIIGTAGTGYFTIPAFRERVNSTFNGLIFGKKGRKSKKSESPAPKRRVEKTEKCIVCGKSSPISDLDEASMDGSKGKLWIHPDCHGE